jgi:hypothetical protein
MAFSFMVARLGHIHRDGNARHGNARGGYRQPGRARRPALADDALPGPWGQCSGESGEQDVEAAFELGGAVVAGQYGGEAAQRREFADRQPVRAKPQQVVGLVGVVDELPAAR